MCRRLFKIPTDLEILEMILSMCVLKFSTKYLEEFVTCIKYLEELRNHAKKEVIKNGRFTSPYEAKRPLAGA